MLSGLLVVGCITVSSVRSPVPSAVGGASGVPTATTGPTLAPRPSLPPSLSPSSRPSPSPSAPPPSATPSSGATNPPPTGLVGDDCTAIPSFDPSASFPPPDLPVDAVLLGEYPTSVAGQPITDAVAIPWISALCESEGQDGVDSLRDEGSILGFDLTTASIGSFDVTVGGDTVSVTAIRTPGQDVGTLLTNDLVGAMIGVPASSELTTGTVGGKTVSISVGDGDDSTYYYETGDTLFDIDTAPVADAAAILEALP